jgi:hypothetical protein
MTTHRHKRIKRFDFRYQGFACAPSDMQGVTFTESCACGARRFRDAYGRFTNWTG